METREHLYKQNPTAIQSSDDAVSVSSKQDDGRRRRYINLITVTLWITLIMVAVEMYFATYSQWLYERFQEETLGANYSKLNTSTFAKNPCRKSANENKSHAIQVLLEEAQSRASVFSNWCSLVELVPALIVTAVCGAYSDQIGRKVFFIVPTLGVLIRIILSWAICFWHLNIKLMLVAMFIEGITGTYILLFMALYIYISDNTMATGERSMGMVLISSLSKLLTSATHLASGYFITYEGFAWPFATSAILVFVAIIGFIIFLRETMQKKTVVCVNVFTGIKNVFNFYIIKGDNPIHKRKDFLALGFVFFLFGFVMDSFETMYLMSEPFCWTSQKYGEISMVKGICGNIITPIILHLCQRFMSDDVLLILGLVSAAAGRFVMAFSIADWMVFVAYALGLIYGIVFPLVRAILSRMVPEEKRGAVFASLASIEVVTMGVASVAVNSVYAATLKYWRGMAYLLSAICLSIGIVLTIVIAIIKKRRVSKYESYKRLRDGDSPINENTKEA